MNPNRMIIAFDPGRHCGFAKWDHGQYMAKILEGDEAVEVLLGHVKTLRLGAVVIEDFTGMQHPGPHGRFTLLLVGRLIGVCEALGIQHAVHTMQAKDPFITPAEILLGKKHTKHASDDVSALAHLMAYQERMKH